tara:strand:- start:636 stop:962 length:327 start_codon:yes stop_codon:yes gene_type:complete
MTDFTNLLSQAKQMQEKMKEAQESLKKIEVEGVSGGDEVKAIMTGDGELKNIFIEDSLLNEPKEIIEDLIVAAHNNAKTKLKQKTSEEISKATGGIGMPPGFKFPFQG